VLALLGPNGAGKTTTVRMLGHLLLQLGARSWPV
jgi:ABC-type multidrug transport system ATPase subunit